MKYKTKPVEIDAVQWKCDNYEEIATFSGDALRVNGNKYPVELSVWTRKGYIILQCNDWIVKSPTGEFYRMKSEFFEAAYEPVEESI